MNGRQVLSRRAVGEKPRPGARPRAAGVHPVLALQQAIGNQAVAALLRNAARAPEAGPSEREEESAAAQELQPAEPSANGEAPAGEGDGEAPGGGAGLGAEGGGEAPDPVMRLAERGGGSPLPGPLRASMERSFRHEFSDVRVHDGPLAAEAARSVNASAYTLGRDIVFAEGAFQPHTPSGLHLLAHELTHVVQQSGSSGVARAPAQRPIVGPAHSADEDAAERTADAVLRGQLAPPPSLAGGGMQRTLQRAVSKICNPPSGWFVLGGPQNIPAASAFGAIAETAITLDIIRSLGVGPGNFYFDNALAGPIDPLYAIFLIAKNPHLTTAQKLAITAAIVVRPDALVHQPPLTQFEEVKPNSAPGRYAGRAKVAALQAFYALETLPYLAGTTYVPMAPIRLLAGSVAGVPITITFEVSRDRAGLIVYDICVETDWLLVSLLAIALAIAVILIILSDGALGPVLEPIPELIPGLLPAAASVGTGGAAAAGALASTQGGAGGGGGGAAGGAGGPGARGGVPPSGVDGGDSAWV